MHGLFIQLIVILILFQNLPLPSFQSLANRYWALHGFVYLRYAQLTSFMTHEPLAIATGLHALSVTDINALVFPQHISVYTNRSKLGFKKNLRTPYAGTLFINTPERDFRITFPVGLSILKWYR